MAPFIETTPVGLWCSAGGFHIDPWQPVDRAVVTHAHSDHAAAGCRAYLTSPSGAAVLRRRVGDDATIETLPFGPPLDINGVRVSLHPAGHVLGSAQVRLEHAGHVCVVSGDYKTRPDRTCEAFELVRCDTFVTESTFGLPIYRWPPQERVFEEINAWWRANQARLRTSVLFAYALGKAQRVIAGVDASIGPIVAHGAVANLIEAYREAGVAMPEVRRVEAEKLREIRGRALVVAPPSAGGSTWMRKFGSVSTAMASGWMQVRGARRWRNVDRGFVLSDHADWPALLETIRGTGASRVEVTHGFTGPLVRYLREQGMDAHELPTRFGSDDEEPPANEAEEERANEGTEEMEPDA